MSTDTGTGTAAAPASTAATWSPSSTSSPAAVSLNAPPTRPTVAAVQDDLLAPLTQPERDQLVRLLTRLLDHHARAAPHPTGHQPT
jgi:hypothetical protein